MRICRKYSSTAVFVVSLSIFMLAPFSGADSTTVHNNSLLNRIVPLSSAVRHLVLDRVPGCKCAHKGSMKTDSEFAIFLCKLQMALDDDFISKIAFLNNSTKFTKHPLYLCNRFRSMPSGPTIAQGFHLSFSGLSPPSL